MIYGQYSGDYDIIIIIIISMIAMMMVMMIMMMIAIMMWSWWCKIVDSNLDTWSNHLLQVIIYILIK